MRIGLQNLALESFFSFIEHRFLPTVPVDGAADIALRFVVVECEELGM